MSEIEVVVRGTLQEIFPAEVDNIRLDTPLRDLLVDSLDMLEFKMRLEEKLDVEIDVDVFESSATLGEITAKVVASLQHT
jgi:acyl carrier protein